MDYRKINDTVYIRMDKDDEVIGCILDVCRKEKIMSAIFSGIGGLGEAEIQTLIPETNEFETRTISGMLELVSMTGNVISDEYGEIYQHTHAIVSYKEDGKHCVAGGHIKSLTVSYTAEIELRPVIGGVINRKYDPETGTGFWKFEDWFCWIVDLINNFKVSY